ncbi:hypothetical protein MPSEU_000169700 [Mayamaea pseudoterrestris]|nr:hypothetical protein MPSEU_000169700 [Mayamaea pseudoterrestris]
MNPANAVEHDDAAAAAESSRQRHHDDVAEDQDSSGPNDGKSKRQRTDTCLSKKYDKKALGSDVLTLNIGGEKLIQTLRSTLTYTKGSKLAETFSGRWDDSLPKNEQGSFFIDYKPELFVPLLDFLRTLSSMTATTSNFPPMTPSFKDPKDELGFRTMVDAFGLTNVCYNYEIYKFGESVQIWNSRSMISQNGSILDITLENDQIDAPGSIQRVCLDRPKLKFGASHTRQVQAFEVALSGPSLCRIGWIHREPIYAVDRPAFLKHIQPMIFDTQMKALRYIGRDGLLKMCNPIAITIHENSVFRCGKNIYTDELEFFIDGALVAATNRSLEHGKEELLENVCLIGWKVPDDCELIPYVEVSTGSCKFSNVELED